VESPAATGVRQPPEDSPGVRTRLLVKPIKRLGVGRPRHQHGVGDRLSHTGGRRGYDALLERSGVIGRHIHESPTPACRGPSESHQAVILAFQPIQHADIRVDFRIRVAPASKSPAKDTPRNTTPPTRLESNVTKAIDMFCGIGGFALAAQRTGLDVIWANDSSPEACRVYSEHFQHKLSEGGIWNHLDGIPPHDLLMAGLPCQSFSTAGRKLGVTDIRGTLFGAVAEVLRRRKPAMFVLENVPNMERINGGRDMHLIMEALEGCGYGVSRTILNAADFGLAQNRPRLFIVGRRGGKSPFIPAATNERAVLSDILETNPDFRYDLHDATLRRLERSDKVGRLVGGVRVLWNQNGGSRMGYTIFGTDGLAPTLTASSSRHYERYVVDGRYRRLTPNEYARLQGFPDGWCDTAPRHVKYKLLGNAVPPPAAGWAIRAALGG